MSESATASMGRVRTLVQELFELLSAQLSSKWAAPTLGPGCLSVEADSNIAHARGLGAVVKPGMYLLIPTSTYPAAMPKVGVDGAVESDGVIERCLVTATAVGATDRVRLDRVFADAIDTQQYWIQARTLLRRIQACCCRAVSDCAQHRSPSVPHSM